MEPDTAIGGPGGRFPATRRSLLLAVTSDEPARRQRAFESLVSAYWKPVYKYIRIRWRTANEDAKDQTQEFFTRALERDFFRRYDPEKAGFRTYLRHCLDAFLANEHKASRRQKRGGGIALLSLDFETAEGELRQQEIPDGVDLEELFHREWVRSLFELAVEALRERCEAAGKQVHFALFQRYDLEGSSAEDSSTGGRPTYAALARQHGIPVTQVTNYLAAMRRDFRRLVLELLRETTGSDAELRSEARALLGVTLP